MEKKTIEATARGLDAPLRVSSFLKTRLGLSGTMIKRVKYGGVFLNGENVHMRATVQNGDRVKVFLPEEKSEHVAPKEIALDVLYEDGDILVVNKPAGMPMHPARNNFLPTLAEAVAHRMLPQKTAFHAIGRLDRDTRGIVLIAKNAYIAELLTRAMKRGEIRKEYTARVRGIPDPPEGTIDAPIAREREQGMRRIIRYEGEAEGFAGDLAGKRAVTHYRTVGADPEGNAVLKLRIETGRTHQIRVHMAHIGHPLVGDFLYGERIEGRSFDLVCSSLSFPHPTSGARMTLTLPDDIFTEKEKNMTIRSMIEPFAYPLIERYVNEVDLGGEETTLFGVRVLDEKEKFVLGTLAEKAILLYIRARKNQDENADDALRKVKKFLGYATESDCKTWGKFALLRGYAALKKAGLIDDIDPELTEKVKEKTDYTDFFNKETVSVNMPSNYLQVAMACAGLRELLGWENEGWSGIIREKLISVMEQSDGGWMDEQPPYGRFDRYSILVTSELSDTLEKIGAALPPSCAENLRLAADICLKMANRRGDGVNYGRSLSTHGDGAAAEILSSALARRLIGQEDIPLALAYIAAVVRKLTTFWYDEKRGSFNIFWDGRSTNRYRQVHRVLEVNLDMANHMLTLLHNLEIAGLADRAVDFSIIPAPEKWTATEVIFSEGEGRRREAAILRKGDDLVMLPLIGAGSLYRSAAYLPFPALLGRLEGAPEAEMPFLVPEYRRGEARYMPISFYSRVETREGDDCVTVRAEGKLAVIGEKYPAESDIGFTAEYRFEGAKISARYSTGEPMDEAGMIVGSHTGRGDLTAVGFDEEQAIPTEGVYDFMTPTGPILTAAACRAAHPSVIGWDAAIDA